MGTKTNFCAASNKADFITPFRNNSVTVKRWIESNPRLGHECEKYVNTQVVFFLNLFTQLRSSIDIIRVVENPCLVTYASVKTWQLFTKAVCIQVSEQFNCCCTWTKPMEGGPKSLKAGLKLDDDGREGEGTEDPGQKERRDRTH